MFTFKTFKGTSSSSDDALFADFDPLPPRLLTFNVSSSDSEAASWAIRDFAFVFEFLAYIAYVIILKNNYTCSHQSKVKCFNVCSCKHYIWKVFQKRDSEWIVIIQLTEQFKTMHDKLVANAKIFQCAQLYYLNICFVYSHNLM